MAVPLSLTVNYNYAEFIIFRFDLGPLSASGVVKQLCTHCVGCVERNHNEDIKCVARNALLTTIVPCSTQEGIVCDL